MRCRSRAGYVLPLVCSQVCAYVSACGHTRMRPRCLCVHAVLYRTNECTPRTVSAVIIYKIMQSEPRNSTR